MKWLLIFFALNIFLLACSSLGKKQNQEWSGRLTPKQEHLEVTRYQYQSHSQFYNQDSLSRERSEATDFVVLTRFVEYDAQKDHWQAVTMTAQKDGPVVLWDLGFPEKNERIEYVWDSHGRVYKAGRNEPQSLFFIPSFPYPLQSMKLKQSWNYEHDWITKKGLSMKLKVTATLADKGPCYQSVESCWVVDMRGEVVGPPELNQKNFKSAFVGRSWVDDKNGLVVQSWASSLESIQDENERVEVKSCLSSQAHEGNFPPCPLDTPK